MRITVNDEPRTLTSPPTVAELLAQFGLAAERVAVEVNQALVRRGDFAATRLRDGDQVEIVTLVGGG